MAIVKFKEPSNNKKPLIFSRATRRQIYTIDLAAIFFIHIDPDHLQNSEDIKEGKDAIIDAFKAINPHFPNIFMSKKDEAKFKRQELKIREVLSDCFKDNYMTPDFLNALLLLSEKASNNTVKIKKSTEKPPQTPLEKAWNKIIASMCNILDQIDPNMSDQKWSLMGNKLANKLEVAMGVA